MDERRDVVISTELLMLIMNIVHIYFVGSETQCSVCSIFSFVTNTLYILMYAVFQAVIGRWFSYKPLSSKCYINVLNSAKMIFSESSNQAKYLLSIYLLNVHMCLKDMNIIIMRSKCRILHFLLYVKFIKLRHVYKQYRKRSN